MNQPQTYRGQIFMLDGCEVCSYALILRTLNQKQKGKEKIEWKIDNKSYVWQ